MRSKSQGQKERMDEYQYANPHDEVDYSYDVGTDKDGNPFKLVHYRLSGWIFEHVTCARVLSTHHITRVGHVVTVHDEIECPGCHIRGFITDGVWREE